jgi:hypothetical protein
MKKFLVLLLLPGCVQLPQCDKPHEQKAPVLQASLVCELSKYGDCHGKVSLRCLSYPERL